MLRRAYSGVPIQLKQPEDSIAEIIVLGSPTFNAAAVDQTSLKFGPNGISPTHVQVRDTNHDGTPDLIAFFNVSGAGFPCGKSTAVFSGNVPTTGTFFSGATVINLNQYEFPGSTCDH
jgi:hypothetical protein